MKSIPKIWIDDSFESIENVHSPLNSPQLKSIEAIAESKRKQK